MIERSKINAVENPFSAGLRWKNKAFAFCKGMMKDQRIPFLLGGD